jgi:uncharacterized protein (DUF427 family)
MTLTLSNGPLAPGAPDTRNYEIVGPRHKLLFTPFPRRVRATFAGETIVDTDAGMLLHESNLLPVLYVPRADVAMERLVPNERHTHCPFKGDASYWDVVVGDQIAEGAVWAYPEPIEESAYLADYVAIWWERMDHWYDEDEEVFGHLRDPYHRVDVRPTSRKVRVVVDGAVVATSEDAVVLSETGLPNRWYLPRRDVDLGRLAPSETTSVCPYKGSAEYWSVGERADVAWSYPTPLAGAERIAGRIAFAGDGVTVEVS